MNANSPWVSARAEVQTDALKEGSLKQINVGESGRVTTVQCCQRDVEDLLRQGR
jgi:hypothetical protein